MDVNVERIAAAQAERAAKREQEEKEAKERQDAARAALAERSKNDGAKLGMEEPSAAAAAGPTVIGRMTIELYENQTVHVEGPLANPEVYLSMISGATVVLCQQIQKAAVQHAVARIREQVPQATRGFLDRIIAKAFPPNRG